MFVPPRYSEEEARTAIAASRSYAEALRRMGMCGSGGNWRTLHRYAEEVWKIPTDHFDPNWARRALGMKRAVPLEEVMVTGSTYSRKALKRRLLAAGLKVAECEMCGLGEIWKGRRMALILDHINGVADDHRLENLRMLCPNCAATLDTHCGRNSGLTRAPRSCARCGVEFRPNSVRQRYCSSYCGTRTSSGHGPRPWLRRVVRPPYPRLTSEIQALGYEATGRRYGVTGRAIRKWVKQFELEREDDQRGQDNQAAA